MSLSLDSVTGTEPVSAAEAKDHLRVDISDDDAFIDALTVSVREYCEQEWNRALIEATYILTLDDFPRSRFEPIRIPRPPLRSITSIKYLDTAGTEQTWTASEYMVETFDGPTARPGRVYPKADFTWPATQGVPGAVSIKFSAGYDDLPTGMRAGILLLVGDLYEHRESQVTGAVFAQNRTAQRIMHRYRLPAYA